MPPVVAIVLAILTQRIVLSLFLGVVAGALLLADGQPLLALHEVFEEQLWKSLVDEFKLRVFAFTLLMGAMVGIINRCGGMKGLIQILLPFAGTKRRGQLVMWGLGLLIFFDDYANTVLLGNTLRPLADRLKISREKLAYLVDSTAAPVAGLALVSTWVAVELSAVQEGLKEITTKSEVEAFGVFVASIPYRFYILFALLFVPMVAVLNRDFWPMTKAERKALEGDSHPSQTDTSPEDETAPKPATPGRWYNALIPIGVTVGLILYLIYLTGLKSLSNEPGEAPVTIWRIFGQGDSAYALLWGSLAGVAVAALLAWSQRILAWSEISQAAANGAKVVAPALVILWLASTISGMTGGSGDNYAQAAHRLYTGDYLSQLFLSFNTNAEVWYFPTLIFLLASVIAFATGTSWGTMALLMPLVIPTVYKILTINQTVVFSENPIILASVGSVLAGAIFGDHCSPISDTTVLSSQASGCNHIAHVRTQLPYALFVAGVAILFGTLPVGLGIPIWLTFPLGLVVLWMGLRFLGQEISHTQRSG